MPKAVIASSGLRIGEHGICLADLFEACLGLCVTRVGIRVVFTGLLPVRALEFAFAGVAAHLEQFVVVGRHLLQVYCEIDGEIRAGACALSPSPSDADSRWLTVCTAASALE